MSFVVLPVAHDAITIIVNSANTWASTITVPELRTLWDAAAEKKITFDYFTDSINGRAGVKPKGLHQQRG